MGGKAAASTTLIPPASLSATVVSHAVITLSWIDTNTREKGYEIVRCLAASSACEAIKTRKNTTSYQDQKLASGTGYAYRIRAVGKESATSAYSEIVHATTLTDSSGLPPVADAGPDQISQVQLSLTFDGSGSQDTDGRITSYAWDFGDGQAADGQRVSYSYTSPGSYSVSLTVTDDTGAQGTDTAMVTISSILPSDHVEIHPGDDVQAAIDANPAGTTFLIKAGVHRLTDFVIPKESNHFIGEPGAILNGSQLLSAFEKRENSWVATGQTMENPELRGVCADGTDTCKYANDVYYDDLPLRRVMSSAEVIPGTFHFDHAGDQIYIGNDPTGHKVEVGVATRAFKGAYTGVSNVVVQGLIIEKFANESGIGAINGRQGWRVEDCEVRLNHGAGVNAHTIRNSYIHHNGQIGIVVYGLSDGLYEGNEIAFNNYAEFDSEYGGTKFLKMTNLTIRENSVHDNDGPGLWTDYDNIDVVYEENTVENNMGPGIFHEISYDAIIRNNVIRNNNLEHFGQSLWWGANIHLNASQNVEIYGNLIEGGIHGIGLVDSGDRGTGSYGPFQTHNVYVHGNVIKMERDTTSGTAGQATISAEANNHFENNSYYLSDLNGKFFRWESGNNLMTKEQWQALGHDGTGTFQKW